MKKILLPSVISLCFTLISCNINLTSPSTTDNYSENSFNTLAVSNLNADWMANLSQNIGNKSLRNIVIPGTHDSGTHSINESSDFAPDNTLDTILANIQSIKDKINKLFKKDTSSNFKKFISAWSRAQSTSIYDQLQLGIRYLDLRVFQKPNGQMFIVHGMYSDDMDTVINDIKRFIKVHPKEIIILDFNHLYNMKNSHEILVKKLNDAFTDTNGKSRMVPASRSINVTPNQLWQNNEQIIALYDDKDTVSKHPELWSQSAIFSPWANKQEVNDLKNSLQLILDGNLFNNDKQNFDCKKANDCEKVSKDKLFVLQGILTPDTKVIVNNLSLFLSLKDAEEDYNNANNDLQKINQKFKEIRNKYNDASFFLKPFYGLEYFSVGTDQKLKQNRFNNSVAELKKAQIKYNSAPNSLKQFAAKTTPVIRDLIKNEWSNKNLNIVITDWFETTDIVEVIKDLNKR